MKMVAICILNVRLYNLMGLKDMRCALADMCSTRQICALRKGEQDKNNVLLWIIREFHKFTLNSKIRSEFYFSFESCWSLVKVFNTKVVPDNSFYLLKNSQFSEVQRYFPNFLWAFD
jgi:hypothetical protein